MTEPSKLHSEATNRCSSPHLLAGQLGRQHWRPGAAAHPAAPAAPAQPRLLPQLPLPQSQLCRLLPQTALLLCWAFRLLQPEAQLSCWVPQRLLLLLVHLWPLLSAGGPPAEVLLPNAQTALLQADQQARLLSLQLLLQALLLPAAAAHQGGAAAGGGVLVRHPRGWCCQLPGCR